MDAGHLAPLQLPQTKCREKRRYPDSVDGWSDHAHCLVSLNKNLSMLVIFH